MTKFQKQMLTIAAAGALTAVTALPAMAFENEFHGIYNFNTVFSNYNSGTNGNFTPTGDKKQMNNYMEQRTRLQYTAKASDDLKLVTHFEMNTRFGASNNLATANQGTPSVGSGGRLDTDQINLVTKWAFLDFNVGKSFNVKVGQMPYKDGIKGLFIDADAPAIYTTTKMGAYTLGLGFSRFADDIANGVAGVTQVGGANKDLFIMDNTFAVNKDTKVALSYYFLADYASSFGANIASTTTNPSGAIFAGHTQQNNIMLHTLGLSGETKLGGLKLSGFAAMQAGYARNNTLITPTTNLHGWAANVAANMKLGNGTAKTGFLFVSGNNSNNPAQYKGWISSSVNSYNESGMMILARNTANSPTSTDQYIRRDVSNIALLNMGYDAKLTDNFNLDANVGFAWAPSSFDAPKDLTTAATSALSRRNNSDFMGTEINMTAGYQLYKNLKLQAQAAYMILGGYYAKSTYKNGFTAGAANAADPENPYTMRLQARYSF